MRLSLGANFKKTGAVIRGLQDLVLLADAGQVPDLCQHYTDPVGPAQQRRNTAGAPIAPYASTSP